MKKRKPVFKVLGVVVGLVLLGLWGQDWRDISHMKAVGQPAVVEPITGYTRHKSRGFSTFTAEFRFKTAGGDQITRKTSFPEELIADFEAGRPVKVFYDPAHPAEFVFEKQSQLTHWITPVTGVCLIIGALVFL